ncbi:ABC transporter permease/substrate binding protein [uncultured Streptococcus sp.]|uniref:ABC transporter permease/substrate binding protein n=1 Tax=Streptococcus TaxID=1301 RepID=UPI0025FC5638|nr:ABC transporter permease/substrate binding protein [uncultured Streptococcus sp.]MCI6904232.1 ABC transporter permease/substrate binding protein [Streptococcus alactolyticus]MDD7361987.1 ABC transporter permease/substrate binding protein [Streptococcus alactolyticus]HEL1556336.1 ABC transporter permease/substrate binding protein [Streptococcus suis]
MDNLLQNNLPIEEIVDKGIDWITDNLAGLFRFVQVTGDSVMDFVSDTLTFIPPLLLLIIISLLAYVISNKKKNFAFLTALGLLFIYNQGLWEGMINTFTLVLVSSFMSIILGIPLGIWMAKSDRARSIINPILDFMQTMPAFVYLIPAVAFFGIGMVPGVFASVIFALPPTVRFTNLGIREIPEELIEAAESFGSTERQRLFKVELPLAKNTILAGVNQTIMLALSMVVTASMIGAPGLGNGVLSALQHAEIGAGFVSGLALVILAIIIDRFTQFMNQPKRDNTKKSNFAKFLAPVLLISFFVTGITQAFLQTQTATKEEITLAYVEWDSEVASTNVLAEVLKAEGYEVNLVPLDNAVAWKAVAAGNADASVSAWLPTTHQAQYEQYESQIEDLGANLVGTSLGFAVPSYMNISSIDELTSQAEQTIIGIEPGAGIMSSAETALTSYTNLNSWTLTSSSTGAMVTSLEQALKNEEDIVVTAWMPHWMFAKYDLVLLEDPQGIFGNSEEIHTIVRKGLKEDQADAYSIIDNFYWEPEDMQSVMLAIAEGQTPSQAAKNWIELNPDKVEKWLD